jgi:hypothetical protein
LAILAYRPRLNVAPTCAPAIATVGQLRSSSARANQIDINASAIALNTSRLRPLQSMPLVLAKGVALERSSSQDRRSSARCARRPGSCRVALTKGRPELEGQLHQQQLQLCLQSFSGSLLTPCMQRKCPFQRRLPVNGLTSALFLGCAGTCGIVKRPATSAGLARNSQTW